MIVSISCSTWLNSNGDSAPYWPVWDDTLYLYTNMAGEKDARLSLTIKRGKVEKQQHSVALQALIIHTFVRERLPGAPHLCFSRGREGSMQHASRSQLPEAGERDGREDLRIF